MGLPSLAIVLHIPHIWNVARQFVNADLVDEVSAHGVEEVGVLVDNILVVEEELVGLEQLLLLDHQLVSFLVVLHYLVVFHVVIRYGLTSKHYQRVFVHHVETHQPYPTVKDGVKNGP